MGAEAAARATPAIELDPTEVTPLARVKRSRLAFAMAITLAALPILVIDNLPATAEAEGDHVEAVASSGSSEAPPSTTATTAAPSSTSTTVAPTTTAAPTTTEAPSTTEEEVQLQAARMVAPVTTTTVAPPTTRPPVTTTTTVRPPTPGSPSDPATWDRLAACEAGGNWALNTGNGYYGGLQFSLATWKNVGGVGYPHQASRAEQIKRGQILQARAGWGQWPYCARQLGLL